MEMVLAAAVGAADAAPKTGPSEGVRMILNDLSLKGGGLFSLKALLPGQEIRLTLTEPRVFSVFARVVWCQEHNMNSHVISQESFSFRVGVEFVVKNPDDEKNIQALYEYANQHHIFKTRA